MSRVDELKARAEELENRINRLSKIGEEVKEKKEVKKTRKPFEKLEMEFFELVSEFKNKQLINAGKYGELIPELRIQKQKANEENLIKNVVSDTKEFLKSVENSIELLRAEKRKIINPMLSSDNLQERLIGEMQVNSGLEYISITRPMEHIERDILDALDSGRVDFANTVLQYIIGKTPDDKTPKKTIELRTRLIELANELYKETDLAKIEPEIKQLLSLKDDIKKFLKAIEQGQLMYRTKTEWKLDTTGSIKDKSFDQWEKSVEIMNG